MVMHAKKFPRLADGVTDRVVPVEFEDRTMNASHAVRETYADKKSDNDQLSCDGTFDVQSVSPADYQHKARTTDRDRHNMHRHRNSRNCSVEVKVDNQKQKDYKAEVHRLAENICGDWSEHISSTGKRYYYNCRTEISQWEKPKDWNNLYVTSSSSSYNSYNSQISLRERTSASAEQNADDGMRLSGAETSSSGRRSELRFSDKTSVSVSPARSHNAAASAAASSSFVSVMENASTPHSVTTCACVTPYTSPMSRTRPAHCVLNSSLYTIASASSADVYMSDSVLRDSERRRVDGEDMDISPGASTEDESKLTEQSITSAAADPQSVSADLSYAASAAVGSLCEDATASNSTFLNTLAKLQQALQQVMADRQSSSSGNLPTKAVPPAVLNLLATLPSLIYKLKTAGEPTSLLCQSQPADQQQITVQVIQMLQKLQQILMAQQQRQQQRQLHELLLQLLAVHKLATNDNISPPIVRMTVDQVESPYSPPDSDGTPLGSPTEQRLLSSAGDCSLILPGDIDGKAQAASNHLLDSRASGSSPGHRQSTSSPKSLLSTSGVSNLGAVAAAATRKQDSAGLTPTLCNYVNAQLMHHIAGWQTDTAEKQANCYAEESYSLSSLHCAEVSVDLKRARSLVRVNEIQSTLQEQRVMFMRQHTRDLETLRTNNSYYGNMPSDT